MHISIILPSSHLLLFSEGCLHHCPPDPSPAHADSRCSLTPLALLPPPLPSTADMHKHTPAANNRGLIQGGHTADPAGPLSRTVIWTWAAAMQRPQCCRELLKSKSSRSSMRCFASICGFNNDLISQNKDNIKRGLQHVEMVFCSTLMGRDRAKKAELSTS